ncbi:glycoside hydrolase family 94 protein [Apiospora hydei]|uniref:Glycoside hydrolase family 94 protein n=1 Tax=Apiospora hydei TaxID=1337664 RepID=A0ABR1WXC8_9PEZI
MAPPLLGPTEDGSRYELYSPTALPKAGGFLWNQRMMVQMTCRGYAVAQFMQPEPAKYAHAPNLEARTFMQPEQAYYAHHPGRFVYVKDEESGDLFSAPYEPVRAPLDDFVFSVGKADLAWKAECRGLRVEMALVIPTHDVAELWRVRVVNTSGRPRRVSVYPYFTIGYMSWMNQGAVYREDLGGIVGTSITPYQKAPDYFKNKLLKDKTYLLCETPPDAWEAMQEAFEGEGGLHNPSAIQEPLLQKSDALYETPAAAVQYQGVELAPDEQKEYRFLFGPALDDAEIRAMKAKYLSAAGFAQTAADYAAYIEAGSGCLRVVTPDAQLDNLVNHWLPRQGYYHGDVNRLTTDPQTRNYLQDNMGMSYIRPGVARQAFVTALSQQEKSGAMPDGIILVEGAELKYINQVPHTDHCVWLPVALEIYLAETGDWALLDEPIRDGHGDTYTAFERFSRAMDWLLSDAARDERGLHYIAQGDWCDPMNMAGWKGKGVSGWLTVATGYALNLWADVCAQHRPAVPALAQRYRDGAWDVNRAANAHFWDGAWFARGITDDGVTFGVRDDPEGRLWLNPQAWALLGGAAETREQRRAMMEQVEAQLGTPYGLVMFAPPYTAMREDVGRVTQKYPGQGENGSVYNHAAVFYIYSLYALGERFDTTADSNSSDTASTKEEKQEIADRAYRYLRQMIPGPDEADYRQRGQLPVYIPNYYRGGWRTQPRTAGRSSQLFNTGTVSWVYRCFIEGLCGLRGEPDGLRIRPQLPSHWDHVTVERRFRGAVFHVEIRRSPDAREVTVEYEGKVLPEARFTGIEAGKTYQLSVTVP